MNKIQDINVINGNNTINNLILDEHQQKVMFLLTQKVDEITGKQMKKIEVQKMEDDLTIKMLEREYLEDKRNFIYSKKKLEETRKKASIQSEMINQLLQAHKAIVEKFNELKRFQYEFILINVNNVEKTSINCINKNNELSNILQIIIKKKNYSKCLNKTIFDKKNILNSDIKKQIKERKTVSDNYSKNLKQSKKEIEILKTQLIQVKVNNNFEALIEEKRKKIIQLELVEQALQKQIQQEVEDLIQEKNRKIENLDNSLKNLEEKKEFLSKFKSELLLIERNEIVINESLKIAQFKHETISNEVTKKREINKLSKKTFNEDIKNINNEQNKINVELQNAKTKFSKNENNMHREFNNLLLEIEMKKKLIKKMEDYQQDLYKLKETKQVKQMEIFNEKDLQDILKKLTEKLKKHEQITFNKDKKLNELTTKIEDLQEKRKNIKQKLELIYKDEKNIINDIAATSNEITIKNSQTYKKTTQFMNSKKKFIENEHESSGINVISNSDNKIKLLSPSKKSIYSFDLDETDESDDELNTKSTIYKKFEESNINSSKTVNNNNIDKNDNNMKRVSAT